MLFPQTVLGLDGAGGAQLYADYWQWEQAGPMGAPTQKPPRPEKDPAAPPVAAPAGRKKLSYLESTGLIYQISDITCQTIL